MEEDSADFNSSDYDSVDPGLSLYHAPAVLSEFNTLFLAITAHLRIILRLKLIVRRISSWSLKSHKMWSGCGFVRKKGIKYLQEIGKL
jgi:hypothetical protein